MIFLILLKASIMQHLLKTEYELSEVSQQLRILLLVGRDLGSGFSFANFGNVRLQSYLSVPVNVVKTENISNRRA